MLQEVETFFPYDMRETSHILVTFVRMDKNEEGFSDFMVIEHAGQEYTFVWDEDYGYYRGSLMYRRKKLEGYIL